MTAEYMHKGSATALLGEHPDRKLAQQMSTELQVTRETPPTFLFTTSADTAVPAANSVEPGCPSQDPSGTARITGKVLRPRRFPARARSAGVIAARYCSVSLRPI